MKKALIQIIAWVTSALVIPLLGNRFVEGWNWTWHDFLFAWVFWIVMGVSVYLITRTFPKQKLLVGICVFLGFVFILGMLATG